MVQSLNTTVDVVMDATSYMGLAEYGKVMVGDKGFEFYNARDASKFIQIPWYEIEMVAASVMFKGRWIPRYLIQTKSAGRFTFASKQPKVVLRAMRKYLDGSQMCQSLSFFQVVKRAFKKSEEVLES